MTERERVARAIRDQNRQHIKRNHPNVPGFSRDRITDDELALADAAIAAIDTRADALREAAAIGRAMSLSGGTPGKIWRKLDAMSEHAQPQPADQKRDEDTGPE